MAHQNAGFFKITNNFVKIVDVPSIQIIKSDLDFIPKITIAIPTFRRPLLLRETLNSAINQMDYDNYDIIVVDNDPERGCNTEKLMKTYNDKRICYYKNSENIGMAGNWNRLFELAVGKYVIMLHDDDLLLPTFLVECVKILDYEPDLGILSPLKIPFTIPLTEGEVISFINKAKHQSILLRRIIDIDNYLGYILGPPSGCLFNKESVVKLGGFNDEYFPSIDYFFVVVFSNYYKTYILHKRLTMYRWDCNESLNVSVLQQFVIQDYFLRKSILKKYKIPEIIIDIFLSATSKTFITNCKKMNNNFYFDSAQLSIKAIPSSVGSVVIFALRVYVNVFKLLKLGSHKHQLRLGVF